MLDIYAQATRVYLKKKSTDINVLKVPEEKKNGAPAGFKTTGENFERGGEKNLFVGQRERKGKERRTVARGPFWISSVSLATGPRPSKAPWAHELFERSPLFSAASFITVTT